MHQRSLAAKAANAADAEPLGTINKKLKMSKIIFSNKSKKVKKINTIAEIDVKTKTFNLVSFIAKRSSKVSSFKITSRY